MRGLITAMVVMVTGGAAAADSLVDVRRITADGYQRARVAPGGNALLVSYGQDRGLVLLDRGGRVIRQLSAETGAGVFARFAADGRIRLRARRAGKLRAIIMDEHGTERTDDSAAQPLAFVRADHAYIQDSTGAIVRVGSGDRFFAPVVSPDGQWVVFQGLASGLYLVRRATGDMHYIGPGTEPAWSPDSTKLVYERTEDDGHAILGSELRLVEVATRQTRALTDTPTRIERRPSFGPDDTIVFDDDRGAIYSARISSEVAP